MGIAARPNGVRPELPALPQFMEDLPVDKRGYPVPWFVDWIKGEPEFRAMDGRKLKRAINEKLCWVCGKKLFEEKIFVIGPMCAVNRISSEPPSHRQCAEFSAMGCPFLSRPHMVRREDGMENKKPPPGFMIERNPGVTLLWYTRRYELMNSAHIPEAGAHAGILFKLGRAFKAEWYAHGREATRAEVMESIQSGLPLLYEANDRQGRGIEGRREIDKQLAEALKLVPRR